MTAAKPTAPRMILILVCSNSPDYSGVEIVDGINLARLSPERELEKTRLKAHVNGPNAETQRENDETRDT